MNRPTYENQEDRDNESRIIGEFCRLMKVKGQIALYPHKLSKKYFVDYALTYFEKGHIIAFVEVKRRNIAHDKIPAIIMSLKKYQALIAYHRLGFKSLLVFEFDDGIFHMNMDIMLNPKMTMNGRNDRGDNQDIEPVVWIPREAWLPLVGAES